MKARKGCWTCTDRKVQCDGGLPTCQKCSRVGRKCQGYEMRLSWPKDNDKKRAIISHLPQVMLGAGPGPNPFFINTTWRDVELHSRQPPQVEWLSEVAASSPDLSTEPQLSASHIDLVQYFYNTAYLSLITFGVDPSQLRDVLLRTATTGISVSRLAVLNALLAFSSLHLNGLRHDTLQLKTSALHYLSASAKKEALNMPEAAQHVAASMLLGSFEILTPSESSGEWIWYIWGALNLVEATHLEYQSHETDLGHLLDWLDYHNMLSRFSIHHWRHKSLTLEAPHVNYPGLYLFSIRRWRNIDRQCPLPILHM